MSDASILPTSSEAQEPTPPTPTPEPVNDVAAASEALAKLGDGWAGLTRDEAGRLHRPDGTFASEEEIAAHQQAQAGEPAPEPAPEPATEATEPPADEHGEATDENEPPKPTVILKGLTERGEEDIELAVDDPAIAERLQRLQNDGMRKKDYEAKLQTVAQEKAEVQEFFTAMEHNPVGTLLQAIPKEASVKVAEALVAEFWDDLLPLLNQYATDPSHVYKTRLDAREQSTVAERQARAAVEANQQAAAILSATEALVPDTVDVNIRARFLADAERDLIDMATRGVAIRPEAVSQLLQDRIRMYGFGQDPVKPTKVAVARRAGHPAPTTTPDVEQAKQVQAALQKTAQVRKQAAAIPPAGRGPVATRKPLVPQGADIETASAALKKANSWATFRPI